MFLDLVYSLPTFLVGAIIVALSVGGSIAGLVVFHRYVSIEVRRAHNDVAGFIISVVGVIYAVLLAFIAVAVWADFNKAEGIVEREASLAGDIFVDALNTPEPAGGEIRRHLREYVDLVVHDEWPALRANKRSERAAAALRELRKAVFRSVDRGPVFQEILDRLNSLYDARRERLFEANQGLQSIAWFVVIVGGVLTVAFTYFFGAPSLRLHMAMTGVLAASIALVIILIVAFDYPFRGAASVTSEPFVNVLRDMNGPNGSADAPAILSIPRGD
jgi:hypothetical protein